MRILVTGISGQLGYDVAKCALEKNHEVIGSGRNSYYSGDLNIEYVFMDITDRDSTIDKIFHVRPDVIVHCAAYTNVDESEVFSQNHLHGFLRAHEVNINGTMNIVDAARLTGAKLVYISTDYVFDGSGNMPWSSYDECNPLNEYGKTKYFGEQIVKNFIYKYFIVRTSWVFGSNGNNFVKTMLKLADKGEPFKVVNDQIGRPTYTVDLAELILKLVETECYDIYHATNSGEFISWYDFAKEILNQIGSTTEVIPVSTNEYDKIRISHGKATRPYNSRLNCISRLSAESDSLELPRWKNALIRYLKEIHAI